MERRQMAARNQHNMRKRERNRAVSNDAINISKEEARQYKPI